MQTLGGKQCRRRARDYVDMILLTFEQWSEIGIHYSLQFNPITVTEI